MPATALDVIQHARAEIGNTESPADTNRTKYGVWYGMNGVPWCAIFVSWVMHHSGIDLRVTTPNGFAYCPFGVTWFGARGLLRASSRLAKPGDIVFYNFHGGQLAEHTGIVLTNGALAASLDAIEGNTGQTSDANGGTVMTRTRDRSLIVAVADMQSFYAAPKPAPVPSWRRDNPTHPTLVLHAHGQPVMHMQSLLLRHGANIVLDGIFGSFTATALLAFQHYHGLKADDVCGPFTWEALHR